MSTSDEVRYGDPAFAGDDRITHEPVVEEERASPLPGGDREGGALRRPFPWAVMGIALAFAVAAVVAGIDAGGEYVIPFVVVAALVIGFVVSHWLYTRNRPDSDSDPIPNLNFDADTPLGATSEQSDAEHQAHADPEPSTGRR
ncbi:MAG TPA: hypothetical protein VNB64_13865 [Solirubrobacteraceae bacterium]|nr:hypothetical protein [Solirubrobacteraceae bacterium]